MGPAWLDPRYLTEAKARQVATLVAEHEQVIRLRERALAYRRAEALMSTTGTTWCREEADFEGCTL